MLSDMAAISSKYASQQTEKVFLFVVEVVIFSIKFSIFSIKFSEKSMCGNIYLSKTARFGFPKKFFKFAKKPIQ